MSLAKPGRKLVSQMDAALIQRPDVPRSTFHGSWTRKTAFDAGLLVPIMVDEILPGDHMKYDVTAYIRLATPLFPLMDNQRIDTFFFYVPSRILWENFKKMMGEQLTPAASIDYTMPQIIFEPGDLETVGSIYDHFGLPIITAAAAESISVQSLPFRAYNKIWNEWFRDQNLQTPVIDNYDDGPDDPTDYTLLRRNKAHDYFTSALPWPQKFTAPTIPIGGMAPVLGIGAADFAPGGTGGSPGSGPYYESGGGTAYYPYLTSTSTANVLYVKRLASKHPDIWADLSEATGVAINDLRQAWMVQGLLERDARGGTRYTELLKTHFGVTNPDFRLQRPEYIGGGQTPLQLTPIAQTAPAASSVVGQLGAAGTAAGTHTASFAATEHGYIIGLINVRSDLSYQHGIHRMWSRRTRYDFYWPALAGLGEQAILQKEIYTVGAAASDDTVFGYQERHHEYRTRYSEVTGIMRSGVTGTLDAWHLSQHFTTPGPILNSTFIREDPPMSRVLAAGELAAGQQYIADILFRRTATRALPAYGTPVSLGRF